MTVGLATIDGVTRAEAAENYMRALAQLVTYVFAVDQMAITLFARPDYMAYLYSRHRVPTPEGTRAVLGFQAAEHCRAHPPYVRTLELVGA